MALLALAGLIYVGLLSLLVIICGGTKVDSARSDDGIKVVATSFPCYDFARAIVGAENVQMLLKPGGEAHTYEPTPSDIRVIQGSDLFLYVGGDSDAWVESLLKNIDSKKTHVIKLMDLVDAKQEVAVEGMQDDKEADNERELDEHVWTSPKNAITIVKKLNKIISKIDPAGARKYDASATKYEKELEEIDADFRQIVKNGKRKEIIVGDRFPLRYFTDEYGLKYYAAFPGCSEQNEASGETIAFLEGKVKEDGVPVVLKMELSSGNIAKVIASETGAKVYEFSSAHNISQKDFDAGVTYADIMRHNEKVLKEALS